MNRVIFTALLLSLFNSSSSALVLYINSFHFEVDNVVLGSQNVEGFIDIPNSQELTNYQLSFDDLIMIFDSTQNFTIDTYDDIDSEMEPTIVETEYAYTNFDYPTFTLTNSKLAFNLLEGDLIFETEEYNMSGSEYYTVFDDELVITTHVINMPTNKITFDYEIYRGEDLIITAQTTLFFVDASKRACRPPVDFREKMKAYFN